LVSPGQATSTTAVPVAGKTPVSLSVGLAFGALDAGTWTKQTAPIPASYVPAAGSTLTLGAASLTAPDAGYGSLALTPAGSSSPPAPLILGRFSATGWTYLASTGSDALDLAGQMANSGTRVLPTGMYATPDEVWIGAQVATSAKSYGVVVRYDPAGNDT